MSGMAGNYEAAVSVLAPLLLSSDAPCPLTFLIAEPSLSSSVPAAAGAVRRTARVGRIFKASTRILFGCHRSGHSIRMGLISHAKQGELSFSECRLLVPATGRKTGILPGATLNESLICR